MDLAQTKGNSLSSDKIEAKINSNSVIDLLRQPNQNPQTGIALRQNIINPNFNGMLNHINIYDAQFSSRLGMLLADQISSGTENFEIQLEPESFGRVRVNVSLESSNVEVKMLADNNAAVLALRGSENMLQNIAEQNGLKLSDYSVGMQNNQNGDGSGREKLTTINLVMQLLKEAEAEVKDLVDLIHHPFQIFLRTSSVILVEVVPLGDQVIEEMTLGMM